MTFREKYLDFLSKYFELFFEFIFIPFMILFSIFYLICVLIELKAEKVTLRKADWECSQRHQVIVPVLAGKTTTMTIQSQCTQWSRKE
jgi:hypothetical protein